MLYPLNQTERYIILCQREGQNERDTEQPTHRRGGVGAIVDTVLWGQKITNQQLQLSRSLRL